METKKVTLNNLELNGEEHQVVELNTGINLESREEICKELSVLLADCYSLMLKTHNYHWNVRGKHFRSVHLITEEQYTDLFTAVDEIAERIRALGFNAPGSFKEFTKLSNIGDPVSDAREMEMVADLVEGHEQLSNIIRSIITRASEHKDEATVDLLGSRLTIHEKNAWMLRSMLER